MYIADLKVILLISVWNKLKFYFAYLVNKGLQIQILYLLSFSQNNQLKCVSRYLPQSELNSIGT